MHPIVLVAPNRIDRFKPWWRHSVSTCRQGLSLQVVITFLMIQRPLPFLTCRERQPTRARPIGRQESDLTKNLVCIGRLGKKEGRPGARSRRMLDELEKTIDRGL